MIKSIINKLVELINKILFFNICQQSLNIAGCRQRIMLKHLGSGRITSFQRIDSSKKLLTKIDASKIIQIRYKEVRITINPFLCFLHHVGIRCKGFVLGYESLNLTVLLCTHILEFLVLL